jgi:hypothetical protein
MLGGAGGPVRGGVGMSPKPVYTWEQLLREQMSTEAGRAFVYQLLTRGGMFTVVDASASPDLSHFVAGRRSLVTEIHNTLVNAEPVLLLTCLSEAIAEAQRVRSKPRNPRDPEPDAR